MNEYIIEQIKEYVDRIVDVMQQDIHTFASEQSIYYTKDEDSLKSFRYGYIQSYMEGVQYRVNTYIKLMQPKPWHLNDDGDYECPECGYTLMCEYDSIRDFNYCPCCGSKMEVSNENE